MWENNKLDETQRGLLNQNIIAIGGEVDPDMAMYIREALLRFISKGSPAIKVLITSGGGSVAIGLDIYDLLRDYSGEKTAVVQGHAYSIAAVILQACEKRVAMSHSHILIHHISRKEVGLDTLREEVKIIEVREEMEDIQKKIYKILSEKTGHTVQEINEECIKDRLMNAEEALKFGLIDEIK